MQTIRIALLASAALSLAACASTAREAGPPAMEAASATQSEHDRLFALFADADERELKLNPISALFRGDMRYADRIGDFLTDEYNDASRVDAQSNLEQLRAIDRSALDETDRLAYDVFAYNQRQALKGLTDEIIAVTEVRPVNHFSGFHTFYPTFASGQSAAPFKTVEDYENNLSRHKNYIELNDRAIALFRDGLESGVLETRLTIGNVIEQLDTQIAMPLEDSPFWMPVKNFPDSFSAAEKARLTEDYRAATQDIYAAHERMRDFLRDEYLPRARTSVGLSQMKGGEALHRQLIESTTTLPLEPDYLHELGLSEVARIKTGLEEIKAEVGFEGTLDEFFDYVRTDPQFKPESREALTQSYYDIGKQVDAKIDELFSLTPAAPLEIRPYETFREEFSAGGSYESGAPHG